MKTTLTQAWEARGLGGAALRTKVRYELTKRFYKENPDKDKLGNRAAAELLAGVVLGYLASVLLFYHIAPALVTLDLSLSLHLLTGIVIAMSFAVFFGFAGVLVVWSVQDVREAGSVERYLFQHRDDEVEL